MSYRVKGVNKSIRDFHNFHRMRHFICHDARVSDKKERMGMTTVLNVSGVDKQRFVEYTENNLATYKVSVETQLEDNSTPCARTGPGPGTRRPPARRTA